MSEQHHSARYDKVAVAFHWIIAGLVLAQIYIGVTFSDMERGDQRTEWFNWHKTVGFVILMLSIVRLSWRFYSPPPPLPLHMPRWERLSARISHALFYILLIALPLTGWGYVSTGSAAQTSSTTPLIGGLSWPIVPGLPRAAHDSFEQAHVILVWTTVALLTLHIAAALKHQLVNRGSVARRMWLFGK